MAYCYFSGEIVEESKAFIPINNQGAHRGFGMFDFFRERDGKLTFMEDHLDRFENGQKLMRFDSIIPKDKIREAVHSLQQKNHFNNSAFKLMILGDGSDSDDRYTPLFFILHLDLNSHQMPVSSNVITYEYLRAYPEIKSINYLTSNMLHVRKKEARAIDVVYHKDGLISEASRSSVFIVKDSKIMTPGKQILDGITRKHVLSFANDISPTLITDVSFQDFLNADEVFLTSTLKEVLPIVKIDGQKVGDGQVGSVTKKIQERFTDHLQA
ncbi:D-alanine transaminase/branched-chain amino acid aminotransferase [Ekhidna lutea]|uniref:branched-chain-amino-acid transaminase n=1 Tax=Ekhidna lutea TaxID=447679 RepID=A0A239LHJ7_EKHLU|nr:aminotransferase class IV [Ekhidna lutea]SNT29941.1 D-alanine transaminase/branched-chain amino acid aminotransferase [Ekhidna lutea]